MGIIKTLWFYHIMNDTFIFLRKKSRRKLNSLEIDGMWMSVPPIRSQHGDIILNNNQDFQNIKDYFCWSVLFFNILLICAWGLDLYLCLIIFVVDITVSIAILVFFFQYIYECNNDYGIKKFWVHLIDVC